VAIILQRAVKSTLQVSTVMTTKLGISKRFLIANFTRKVKKNNY